MQRTKTETLNGHVICHIIVKVSKYMSQRSPDTLIASDQHKVSLFLLKITIRIHISVLLPWHLSMRKLHAKNGPTKMFKMGMSG